MITGITLPKMDNPIDRVNPESVSSCSMDMAAMNRERLKALFPSVFTETLNDKGELCESIDFEKLKAELGSFSDLFESRRERYGMEWPGKREALYQSQTRSFATLKPCREESVNFDSTGNLFIEGDNLEVLKLLQSSYYGKVKMIYIDPPYNTGKEFIYPDNYSESLDTYLEYAGLIDGEGKKFSTNTLNEGRFHTRWLNMMYPRLYLARNLLRDDGVIFISIDDNEVTNLRKLCDEIFGEENFVANIVWQKSYGGGAKSKHIVDLHEYILMYSKDINSLPEIELPPDKEVLKYYKYRDNKFQIRGPYRKQPLATTSMDERPNLRFPIIWENEEIWPEKQWQWSKERVSVALQKDELVFTKKIKGWTVDYKQYLKDEEGNIRGAKPYSLLKGPYTQIGTAEIKDHLGDGKVFSFPKPSSLVAYLSSITSNKDIILDFFAGSATTAHAVLDLNRQDGGNRKFILVQLPEPCAPESAAFTAGYRTIADIGKERIRRVINKFNTEDEGKLDLDQNGGRDRGFKVLKLDKSNFKKWQPLQPNATPGQILDQLSLHIAHIEPQAKPEDLLYEILLKSGIMLTEPVEVVTLAGKTVHSVAEGCLMLCLEETVTKELIDAVIEADPQQFICLDSAFHGNDQLKANAVQTFAARNMQKEKHNQIVFRTV